MREIAMESAVGNLVTQKRQNGPKKTIGNNQESQGDTGFPITTGTIIVLIGL